MRFPLSVRVMMSGQLACFGSLSGCIPIVVVLIKFCASFCHLSSQSNCITDTASRFSYPTYDRSISTLMDDLHTYLHREAMSHLLHPPFPDSGSPLAFCVPPSENERERENCSISSLSVFLNTCEP